MRALDEYMHIVNQLLFQQSSEDAGGEGGDCSEYFLKIKKWDSWRRFSFSPFCSFHISIKVENPEEGAFN